MRRLFVVFAGLAALVPLPALAHPHIFVDAKAAITFNDAGQVVSIHNTWTFDKAYSAWSVQGLDTNKDAVVTREELQPLADDNMKGLADYEYYTFAGEGNDPNLAFSHGSSPTIDEVDGQTTLNFDVALAQPYTIRKSLELSINDPEYYVAITFKDASAVSLINAPKACSIDMQAGHDIPDAIADQLYAIPPDVTKLPPELEQALRGTQGAILINCKGGSASGKPVAADSAAAVMTEQPGTALDAVKAPAAAPSDAPIPQDTGVLTGNIPFGAAPNEPGLNLPRTGFLGWLAQKQKDFYLELTVALAALKADWTAFWLLGGLSFLYGIFHAAGPGHGKVVISAYLLAHEAQVKRGILLSFVSAMLQSLVAIGFVLVAASLLGMTAMAMSDAANWIGIVSYAMIALLGLWLILRKILGWGHKHQHDEPTEMLPAVDPMQSLARRHMGVAPHVLAAGNAPLTSFKVLGEGADAHGRLPGHSHYGHGHGDDARDGHHQGHAHVVTPGQLNGSWREQLSIVLAVGMRPCSGALIGLAFSLSQGLLSAGILAVLLMGAGTAITTGALAAMAVGFKALARRFAGTDNAVTGALVWWTELVAAVGVFAFGIVLVLASL